MTKFGISVAEPSCLSATLLISVAALSMLFSTSPGSAAQGPAKGSVGIECVSEMRVPVYGLLLWKARVTGSADVFIVIAPNGTAADVRVTSQNTGLASALRSQFSTVSFQRACAGRSVQFTFIYKQVGKATISPSNSVTLRFPNIFEITAGPPLLLDDDR